MKSDAVGDGGAVLTNRQPFRKTVKLSAPGLTLMIV